MTVRRSEFNQWDGNDAGFERRRRAWCDWLTQYGINPRDVTVCPGWVEADDDARTITYLSDVRDAAGFPIVEGNSVAKAPRVVQLIEPAAPFPEPL